MLVVHHLEHSRSHRILWLLEELELDYELVTYQRDPKTLLAPPDLKAIHPLGKSPVVSDGDTVLAESGAIIEYVLDHYDGGALRPPPMAPERQQYTYWLHYAEGSLMPVFLMKLVFDRLRDTKVPFFVKPVVKGLVKKVNDAYLGHQIKLHLDYVNRHLDDNDWFVAGKFSAADIQMSYPLQAAASRTDLSAYAQIRAFLNRVRERPAYQRALENGGPVELP